MPSTSTRHAIGPCYEPPTVALRLRSVSRLQDELTGYLARAAEAVERDWRDVLVILATYHDCAARLGADPVALFDAASIGATPATRDVATRFARRTDITLQAFGWILSDLPDGPCYESADHVTFEQLKAAIERMGGHVS
jgi:hypothetical protein